MFDISFADKISRAYTRSCKALCHELDIPQTAFDILMFLANHPEYKSARDIVEIRRIKANLVSINVDRLVQEGLLVRLAFGRWATEQSLLSELYDDAPMQFIHMRIYSVYGSGDHETSLVNTVLRAALRHEAITLGPCEQRWNYLEVHDLARAIRILLRSEETRTGIYDIAGSDSRMLKKYVIAMNAIAARFAANADTAADDATTTAAGTIRAVTASGQTIGTAAGAAPTGAELRFGTRANNAEGAANMSPEILKLQRLGFHQEISFEAGIGMLLKAMREKSAES